MKTYILSLSCLLFAVVLLSMSLVGRGQSASPSAYPSVLWEISGNGLQKPSYLFGSMHISNKEVFHLSDSFYTAIGACDVVALEVDPKEWQPDMFRLQEARRVQTSYSFGAGDGYLTESDFRLKGYDDALKAALREEPFVMNGLLYRTSTPMANFQEDTYLDLYIYQTGRRLGKKGAGVENYLQSERISIEANEAAMKDTKRERKVFPEGENSFTILNKLQDAYRRGDLSLLDSLDDLLAVSKAYTEKFLYQRNDIQAHSIDSILHHQSLFVAVGAAHLPGARGVIEALRKKGYILRPVKMTDEDAHDRERIDRLHVPVESRSTTTDDGLIRCSLPGEWYRREESQFYSSWQYADMENGSYYLLTRIKTNSALGGQSAEMVKKKIDSLLYDNIPGKIQHREEIRRNGYPGLDIVNKTRNGDIQRYMILITPAEILIFKMSGNEDYVSGKEADAFFASVQVKEAVYQWTDYMPPTGGFRAVFPGIPGVSLSSLAAGSPFVWQYTAASATGENYLILKRNLSNSRFLEEDTLDLSLVEESLKGSDGLSREISRKFGKLDGHDCLDMQFATVAGGRLKARAVIRGPEYFLLLAAGKDEKGDFSKFFNGFHLEPYHYGEPFLYVDTTRHFAVRTPVYPAVPEDLRSIADAGALFGLRRPANAVYISETQTQRAHFQNDSTGENIQVVVLTLPDYFYRKDSTVFWENEMHWTRLKAEFILEKKQYFGSSDSVCGYRYTLRDTNTDRKIEGLAMLKGSTLYKLTAVTDGVRDESTFVSGFFDSFAPLAASNGYSMFTSKSALFFKKYHSKDSVERRVAHEALTHILFEPGDLAALEKSIDRLKPEGKTYIETKSRLIRAIGRIRDTCCLEPVVASLKGIYDRSGDTGVFQNAALEAIARLRSKAAYTLVREWIVQKPPVFENATQLRELFQHIGEDTALALSLFPDILQLVAVEGYKTPILQLMSGLADSNRLPSKAYESYFTGLFSDAQLLLKKQRMADERVQDENEENVIQAPTIETMSMEEVTMTAREPRQNTPPLDKYAEWLIPFYDRPGVDRWFGQLLQVKSPAVKLETALLLIRNNKVVPDTLLHSLAADDRRRAALFEGLFKAGKASLFPTNYKNQEAMAKSVLEERGTNPLIQDVVAAGRQHVITKTDTGWVYFFKYKIKGQEGWMIAVSGIQPEKQDQVNTNHTLAEWTRQPLNGSSPEEQQFRKKLAQVILSRRQSASRFYQTTNRMRNSFIIE